MPRVWMWLLVSLLAVVPVAAQTTAAVSGTVRDVTGAPLAGVTVTVTSTAAATTRRVTTGVDGRFALADLPQADDYHLTATCPGFRTYIGGRLALMTGDSVEREITMTMGVTEELRVKAPPGEGSEVSPRQAVGEDLTQDLPILDRGFLHLVSLAPGVTGRPDYPDVQGQHYWTHNVLVDGASDYSKWRGAPRSFYSGYARESVRDVTVLPELFGAEVGGALASVTTATTRAGGDTWDGSAFLFARHTALAAKPVFASAEPAGSTSQYGATIGGPLGARTFLFGSYDGRRQRDHNVVSSPAAAGVSVPTNQDERIAFARIDHRLSDRQTVTVRANLQFLRWHDEPGALMLPGNGTSYTNDAHTILLTHALALSATTLHDLRVQFSRYVDARHDLDSGVYVSRAGYSIRGSSLGVAGLGVEPEHAWEVHETLSHDAGPHGLRFGGSGSIIDSSAVASRYERGAYFFAGSPVLAPTPYLYMQGVPTSPAAGAVDSRTIAASAFAQDDWRVASRVTISAGVRYDIEWIDGIRNFGTPADRNNIQPRLGVTWTVGPHGTLLRAAAGIYTQQHILYPIHQVALQGIDGVATIVVPEPSPAFPSFPTTLDASAALAAAPRDLYRVGSTFNNPYSVQAGAGIEQTLAGLTLAADYLHLTGEDLVSVIDANAPASVTKPAARTVAEADATRPLSPTSGYRKLLTLGNDGRSWYQALQLKATLGRPSVHLVAAYTYAHADDLANYELPEDSHDLAAERGRAAADIRHNLSAACSWQVPGSRPLTRDWQVSVVTTARSGRPYTVTWGDDRNGTTQNDARPGARNTAQTDSYRVVDLSFARREHVRTGSIEFRLELFNLFNTVNFDEYVGTLLSPLFGQPISAFPLRRGQIAVVLRY